MVEQVVILPLRSLEHMRSRGGVSIEIPAIDVRG